VTHSVAAMVDGCRTDPGSLGMVTGLVQMRHSISDMRVLLENDIRFISQF
jgi:hypothetical protein